MHSLQSGLGRKSKDAAGPRGELDERGLAHSATHKGAQRRGEKKERVEQSDRICNSVETFHRV